MNFLAITYIPWILLALLLIVLVSILIIFNQDMLDDDEINFHEQGSACKGPQNPSSSA